MKKIGLRDLALLAEIVAAIGIIVSLVYVGRQVQSNTSAIRSATIQAIANASDEALQNSAANADVARIRLLGDADPSQLTEVEAARYFQIHRGNWIRMQNIYAQQQLGVLEESFWFTYSRIICDIYVDRGVQETWPMHADVLDLGFVEYVETCADRD